MNPIDPSNPETGGRLQNLTIYSELDKAVLRWKEYNLKNLQGFQIYRREQPDAIFKLIAVASPDSNQYIDKSLAFNRRYEYFITILGEDFESPGSDTVSVIPGPTFIWATDVYNRRILKITHDGTHEINQIPVDGYPWELAFDKERNTLWFTDVFLNRVYLLKSNTQEILADFSYGEPIDLALDEKNDRVWIADETQGKIFVFNRQGENVSEIAGFQKPVSLDYFWKDGSCWVVDSNRGTLTKISKSLNIVLKIDGLKSPSSVSINQQNGYCWVADSSRVIVFNNQGEINLIVSSGITSPTRVAVDSELGYCWVLDFNYGAYQSRLSCFSETGAQVTELSGLSYPENLTVNPYDHSCIVAESGTGRILKISLEGVIIGQVSGYDYTHGLFVEYIK